MEDVIHEFITVSKRVLAWDLWNEPDNMNDGSYRSSEPVNKVDLVTRMMPLVFKYARAALPSQPLTSGLWHGDWSSPDKPPIEKDSKPRRVSDIIASTTTTKHPISEKRIQWLQQYHWPILCNQHMARERDSTFQSILPIAKKYNVAAFSWGLVAGKTQTYLPWDSWQHPYIDRSPAIWHHDIFRDNGSPYSQEEIDFIRQITGRGSTPKVRGK